ncbi:smad nuclear-interacting protein 1-like [Mercenaria mercenaria]|uniref:smad nuclear-interacting protein 1-like n=1 Tax=Mercenaria mercenaria TaxID=6596 RepID=UPI00234E4AA4|nr:smad nuclear-interacting protein 1-like [Mercenaria mercenaria]
MVKERYRKSSSSDDDSDDHKRRKHHRKHRSGSPEASHKRHKKHHRHRSRSESSEELEDRHRIKQEPVTSESDAETHRRHKKHIKRERNDQADMKHGRHHYGHGHRHKREHMVRMKQEPDSEEEMRQQRAERRHNDQRRRDNRQKREHLSEHQRYGRRDDQENSAANSEAAAPKDKPDFELSGKLTEDTNTYKGVVIKYNEPPEARKPKKRWRLYPFKNDEALKPFHMHRQSAYLFGRDRIVADIPVDHPSCSKQHAVYQYRMVPYEKEDGRRAHKIAPYIIDLESANGTFVNNKKIEPRRYVELIEKDVIKFGFSSREYVLLHDKSSTAEVESDGSS